jgi:hypothetical protein
MQAMAVLQQNRVIEPQRDLPIRGHYDVLIAGGGLGGIASALAAARCGARTLLVERNGFVGGVATAGMCCSIFNCYFTGRGAPGTTGIALEIADALAEATGYGRRWRQHKGHVIYDLEQAKWVLQDLLRASGAELLLQATVTGAVMEGQALRGLIVETKSGREAILGQVVVDATGDADVAAHSGAPLHTERSGRHSLCFRLGNVDVDAFVRHFRDHPDQYPAQMDVDWTVEEALAQYDGCGTLLFPHGGGMQLQALQRAVAGGDLPERVGVHDTVDACQMHALRRTGVVHVVTGFTVFDGLDAAQISAGMVDGRRMAFAVARAFRNHVPGFEHAYVAGTATNLGVRTSRWLDGGFCLTRAMVRPGARFKDAVGRLVGNDHRTRHPGRRAWSVQVLHDEPFELPYRCLLPRAVEGLIVGAGRSVSAESPWLLRVMVHTMVVGQAAGTAAAVATREGVPPRAVDVRGVQAALARQGVAL